MHERDAQRVFGPATGVGHPVPKDALPNAHKAPIAAVIDELSDNLQSVSNELDKLFAKIAPACVGGYNGGLVAPPAEKPSDDNSLLTLRLKDLSRFVSNLRNNIAAVCAKVEL